jgi:transposase-like protein
MQVRCQQCHKPFALSRETVRAALDMMIEQELHHYNAKCPHCRKTTQVSKTELLRAAPDYGKKEEELGSSKAA